MDALRVLVVDDDELVRLSLAEILKVRGENCVLASSGEEALRLLGKREADRGDPFDVLISDLSMPGMDGLELIRRAKNIDPQLVCLVLSGFGTRDNIMAAIKEGVFDFIEKPLPDFPTFSMILDRARDRVRLIGERAGLLADLKRQNEKLEISLSQLNDAYEHLQRQEETIERDLRQAQHMQQRLLPSAFPRVGRIGMFGHYSPCERMGGDFFGIVALGEDRAAVYIADVAGHGVGAAMVTLII
ncbi:MAG TPA: response regulator, partial [Sumerlaeia bacterium]|nr:response regulator [Sumerlaeia bacterium]